MARTQVAELQALMRRRNVERLARDYGLEAAAAGATQDLIEAGLGEGMAVGEVLRTLETAGPDAVPDRVAEIVGWRKAATT